jgi:hypothetical protein
MFKAKVFQLSEQEQDAIEKEIGEKKHDDSKMQYELLVTPREGDHAAKAGAEGASQERTQHPTMSTLEQNEG